MPSVRHCVSVDWSLLILNNALGNTPTQNVEPAQLEILASIISSAAQDADAQLKTLKGQPVDVAFGVGASDPDVSKSVNAIAGDIKESIGVSLLQRL